MQWVAPDAAAERSLLWLKLAMVLSGLVPAFFIAVASLGYLDAVTAAQKRLDELASTAEQHAVRVLDRNEVVMQQMLLLLKDDGDAALRQRETQLHEIATAVLLRLPQIASLSVRAASGDVLMSTLLPPASRAFAGPDWSLLIGRPGDEAPITLQQSRTLSSGEPGGTIEVTLNRAHFDEFYRRLTEGVSGLTVALVNAQGVLLSSWPPPTLAEARLAHSPLVQRISTGAAAGTFAGSSLFSGERYAAFRKVGDGALYVTTTQDAWNALADWREQAVRLGAIMLATTLALVLASWVALRRTRRELEARRRLREEEAHRGRAEDALRQAQKLDALGQLAGGLAHDFNNLLMVVSANAEMLARVVPQAAARPELAAILKTVDGGGKLTRRLLGFSRKEQRQPEVLHLPAELEDMADLLRTTAGNAVQITLQVEDDTPPVEADKAELEMALINLVANARDAMGHRGRIRIHVRPARPGEGPEGLAHGCAVIAVSDTGQGMSADVLKHAFEPFFTTKPPGVGTGLGLAQVYGFCAQAGGDVEVASKLRVGTTVSMLLPGTSKAVPQAQAVLESRPILSARVLLVEDSAELASTIAASLERLGCAVTPVTTAQEAERLALVPGRFDVVLSDVVMPGADGIALAQRLRKRKPELPVVLITGVSGQARQAVPSGMEVLAKPCGAQEIAGALARAIAARRPAAPMH